METEKALIQILNKLKEIDNRLTQLDERIIKIEQSTKNMDEHIGFVESIYQQVQAPFHSLMSFTQRQLEQ